MTLITERPRTVFAASPKAFAPAPPEHRGLHRDGVRLLVASPDGITHTRFHTLVEHLRPGDAVVVNRSATVAGAWDGHSRRHGHVVLHAANRLSQVSRTEGHRPSTAEDWVIEAIEANRFEALGAPMQRVRCWTPSPASSSSPGV